MHNIVYVVPNVPREPFLDTVNIQHKTTIPTLATPASLCAPAVPQQSKIPSYATAEDIERAMDYAMQMSGLKELKTE